MKKLYVGNLPFQASEEELREWFEASGVQVDNINLIRDRDTGQARGFGFVEIQDDQMAERAIQELNAKSFQDRTLTINEARPQRERGGRGGFSRGGGKKRGPRW